MPTIYRAMKEQNGMPVVEKSARGLGVRTDGRFVDIRPLADGNVRQGIGGMSVNPSIDALALHRVPRRLRDRVPWAAGNNQDRVWRFGDGPWEAGHLSGTLAL